MGIGTNSRRRGTRIPVAAYLYGGLFALASALIVVWLCWRSEDWAQTWLPKLIAEAAGLLVAVVIVDQLLRFDRRLKERPLRRAAGRAFGEALERIINLMAGRTRPRAAWIARMPSPPISSPPLGQRMSSSGAKSPIRLGGNWAESLTQVVEELDRLVDDYREAFDPDDIAHIHDFERRTAADARARIRASKPLAGAVQLTTAMQPVISTYERLAKSKLITESGWATHSLGLHQLAP